MQLLVTNTQNIFDVLMKLHMAIHKLLSSSQPDCTTRIDISI